MVTDDAVRDDCVAVGVCPDCLVPIGWGDCPGCHEAMDYDPALFPEEDRDAY